MALVNWNDPFWSTDKTGANGWLLYDVAGSTTSLINLEINAMNWLDAAGISLADVRPYATFGLEQVGSDVYLTFQAVPEPSSIILAGLGAAIVAWAARRRR